MAQNSSNGVTWFLRIPARHKDVLGSIRHWDNLKMAIDSEIIWVKDFTNAQIESVEIKILPYAEVFYSNGPKLFPNGSGLPHGNVPSLLWSPIDRGLQVTLSGFNHNYFGVHEKASVMLARANNEIEPAAMMVSLADLKKYLGMAPNARLAQLEWLMVGDRVLIRGTPLLPITGDVYWQKGMNFIPAGYDLDLTVLSEVFDSALTEEGKGFILWDKSATFTRIPLNYFRPLSNSSFRNTIAT